MKNIPLFPRVTLTILLFILSFTAFTQTGNITGIIRNCYNNAPIPNPVITIGTNFYQGLNDGSFFIAGLPAGPVTLHASAVGYLSTTFLATIIASQTVTVNVCLNPPPATVTGTVTDCATGAPVIGAKVTFMSSTTYSIAGGIYTINIFPGASGTLTVTKPGYDNFLSVGTYTPPNTYTQNIQLHPTSVAPLNVTASLNTTQDTVHIAWGNGFTNKEYLYDDGISDSCAIPSVTDAMYALKFSICSDATILKFKIKPCLNLFAMNASLYKDDGPGGTPGTQLIPGFYFTCASFEWNEFTFSPFSTFFSQGDYYLIISQIGNYEGIALDTTTNQQRSYSKVGSGPWTMVNGNFLIRVIVNEQCPVIAQPTYTVYRSLWGQEANPNLWVNLGNTTPGSMTFDDDAWGTLPCGPYRYVMKMNNPCGGSSSPSFGNVLGKCWTANVNVHAESCCQEYGNAGIMVKFQNTMYPDSVYIAFTDANGNAVLNNMWKGFYNIFSSASGCPAYIQTNYTLMADDSLNIIMSGGPIAPPSNLNIDGPLMEASWSSPALTCVSGYNVYINSALNGFTADTFYQIPALPALMGQNAQLCVEAVFGYNVPAVSSQVCDSFYVSYLLPPMGFLGDTSACDIMLNWLKPLDGNGQPPAGLVGYNIYRNDNFIHFCPSPDSLSYTESNLNGGVYTYYATSFYDLTAYGHPGMFGESIKDFAVDTVSLLCSQAIPFYEGWNFGTFSFTGWTFEPSQGGWNISNSSGEPVPSAAFTGGGKSMSSAYEYSLVSPQMNTSAWICSDLWFSFDIKFEDNDPDSTGNMAAEVFYSGSWHTVNVSVSSASFDWRTVSVNISEVAGEIINVRFRASGLNQSAINSWNIDNIRLFGICPSPQNAICYPDMQQVILSWEAVCQGDASYNVFRSDNSGNPPFEKLNQIPLSEATYTDTPTIWTTGDKYHYYLTALQYEGNSLICESAASDTVEASFPVGISSAGNESIIIYPNPVKEYVFIKTIVPVTGLQVLDQTGIIVMKQDGFEDEIRISTSGLAGGVYFIRIISDSEIFVRKIVVL